MINGAITHRTDRCRLDVPADLAVGAASEVLRETDVIRNHVERRRHTVARSTVGADVNKKHWLVG